jgi:hypothetical protein
VLREFERFLGCGVLSRGFARIRCPTCKTEEFLAFSCKGRGFCPSCGARRMAQQAAHLIDHVLPEVPVRQWVITLPFELRYLCAYDPEACSAIRRIYMRSVFRWLRKRGRAMGIRYPEPGAVTFCHRFDSALRLNVHFHSVVLDGVYGDEEDPVLHELPAPDPAELGQILKHIHAGVLRYLTRRQLLEGDALRPPVGEDEAVAALAGAALQGTHSSPGGTRAWVTWLGRDPHAEVPFESGRHSASLHGFSLYAGPQLSACSTHRMEKLCRYIARPALATSRLSVTSTGQVLYKLKRPFRDGTHSVLMEPLAFLERLAALTPRPGKHLLTYHGALAPASLLRASIIPAPTEERCTHVQPAPPTAKPHPPKARARSQPYIPWADLMRRVFEVDVLLCPHCLGKRRIVAFLDDPIIVHRILRHVGLDPEPRPPPLPGQLEMF